MHKQAADFSEQKVALDSDRDIRKAANNKIQAEQKARDTDACEIVDVPIQDSRKDARKALKTLNEKNTMAGRPVNKTQIGGAAHDLFAPEKKPGSKRSRKSAPKV